MTISLWHICDVLLCRFGRVFGIMVAVAAVMCLIYLLGLVYLRVIAKPGVGFGDRMIRSNFTRYKKVTICDSKGDFRGNDRVSRELLCFYKYWSEWTIPGKFQWPLIWPISRKWLWPGKGPSLNDVMTLGGRGYQGFCDHNTLALELKSVTTGRGEGVSKRKETA